MGMILNIEGPEQGIFFITILKFMFILVRQLLKKLMLKIKLIPEICNKVGSSAFIVKGWG